MLALAKIENKELDVDELAENVKKVSSLIKICKDKLYKTEEERARTLAELNANKDKFFSIVAHDLINPFQPLLEVNPQG